MRIHSHARARMQERGASDEEVERTVAEGERFATKFGRAGFRRDFRFDAEWQGRRYATKQVEVIAVFEEGDWLAISVIVKYF